MNAHIRKHFVHAWALATSIAKHITHRIFDFQTQNINAFKRCALACHIHFDGVSHRKPIGPHHFFSQIVHLVFTRTCAAYQLNQHPRSHARMQVNLVDLLPTSHAIHATINSVYVLQCQGIQLTNQNLFQTTWTSNKNFKCSHNQTL